MTPAERLVERLRADGWAVPQDWRLVRTYAGHWQRSQGCWSWMLVQALDLDCLGRRRAPRARPTDAIWRDLNLGAQWRVTDLLRCAHWQYDFTGVDVSIDLCAPCTRAWMARAPGRT